jgi:hypothetical protein
MLLSLTSANAYVKKEDNVEWDGWTIVIHKTDEAAEFHKRGRFDRHTQTWGYQRRVNPNHKGMYSIPLR